MEIIPNPNIMLLVFVVFLITMLLLNKFVFQPLIFFMDQRDQKVIKDLQLVSQDDTELARIEKEIQDVLGKAKAEAYAIKEAQIEQAKDDANKEIERIQIENREKMEAFMTSIHDRKEQMKNELKESLGDIESLLMAKIKNL